MTRMPSAEVDALCDRLNGDRNIRIKTLNILPEVPEYNGKAGETVQNVSMMGMDIEDQKQPVKGIKTIEELAETWCKVKNYEFGAAVRHDSVTFAQCKRGMIVLWKGEEREIFFKRDDDDYYIQMRLPVQTLGHNPEWRLYDHQIHGDVVFVR